MIGIPAVERYPRCATRVFFLLRLMIAAGNSIDRVVRHQFPIPGAKKIKHCLFLARVTTASRYQVSQYDMVTVVLAIR